MDWHKALVEAVKVGFLGYKAYRGDPQAALALAKLAKDKIEKK